MSGERPNGIKLHIQRLTLGGSTYVTATGGVIAFVGFGVALAFAIVGRGAAEIAAAMVLAFGGCVAVIYDCGKRMMDFADSTKSDAAKEAVEQHRRREAELLDGEMSLAYDFLEARVREVRAFDPYNAPEPLDFNENENSKDAIGMALTAISKRYGPVEASYFTSQSDFKIPVMEGIEANLEKYRNWRIHWAFLAYRLGRLEKIVERNPKPGKSVQLRQ